MFASDATVFLADLGEVATWVSSPVVPAPTGLMIFGMPDTDLASGEVISADYEAAFETAAWPGLKRGERLSIAGTGAGFVYKLRTDPQRDGDGVFSHVKLSRI